MKQCSGLHMNFRFRKILVSCGYRIHINSIDMSYKGTRVCGGVGFLINEPKVKILVKVRHKNIPMRNEINNTVTSTIERFKQLEQICKPFSINLLSTLYAHKGLGSTTILDMCTLVGLYEHIGKSFCYSLAGKYNLGLISGIGFHSFFSGGLIVDGGYQRNPKIDNQLNGEDIGVPAPQLLRLPFPSDWYVVLGLPIYHQSLSGKDEKTFFSSITPVPSCDPLKISYAILMGLLPSIKEKNFESFLSALKEITSLGTKPHEVFLNRYICTEIMDAMRCLFDFAAISSLGPTVYSFTRKYDVEIIQELNQRFKTFQFTITNVSNKGYQVSSSIL